MAKSPDTTEYFNSFYSTGPGLGNAASYIVSGTPWVTGSSLGAGEEDEIILPAVAKSIQIWNKTPGNNNLNSTILLHFDSKSDADATNNVIATKHFLTLTGSGPGQPASSTVTLNTKCDKFYLSHSETGAVVTAEYEILAVLTGIAPVQMFELTGSGINTYNIV
tara:strand:+ start:4598 stop:5089 length:492 start_codon:yes stop_codon:yes gene_type:complete